MLKMADTYRLNNTPYYDRMASRWGTANIEFSKDAEVDVVATMDPINCRHGSAEVSKSMPDSVFKKHGSYDKRWYRYLVTDSMMVPVPDHRLHFTTHYAFSLVTILDPMDMPTPKKRSTGEYGAKTKCSKCGEPTYEGFNHTECSNGCITEY